MKAIILAGGRGARLRPFTVSFPKPLMPIGERPILEILIRQLRAHGITDVTLLTGHLGHLLEAYFGSGESLGVRISYVRESEPLGTAGPLRQLAGQIDDDVFVMNGDLLTDVDFSAMLASHRESGAAVTIGTYRRDERIELGVLEVGDDGEVLGYDEKPTLHFRISMGLYVMAPLVFGAIPGGAIDMPRLILDLIAAGQRVRAWQHDGTWLDIGRVEDYGRATEIFEADPAAFLPQDRGP